MKNGSVKLGFYSENKWALKVKINPSHQKNGRLNKNNFHLASKD